MIGRVETTYLEGLTSEERRESFELLLSQDIPALIISREIEPFPECMEMAEKYDRTILRSPDTTSVLMSNIIAALKSYLAPRITRHGVLVEVYGEGVLLLGESGVGKSETAIELVKRGHRLIADDAVEIKRNVTDRLVGTAPELIRHYIELRGHRRHRRVPPVRYERRQGRGRDRYGHQPGAVEGRGHVRPPGPGEPLHHDSGRAGAPLTVPVRPGRNLAVIIEVAAMNNRHKKMGYNAAVEFTKQINQHFDQAMSAQLNDN